MKESRDNTEVSNKLNFFTMRTLEKQHAIEDLQTFISTHPDAREMRKALAIKLVYQAYSYIEVAKILDVSIGSISSWKQSYEQNGIEGLRLQHKGRISYLSTQQREEVLSWLQTKDCWNISELESHLAEKYEVVYESKQSYYDLMEAAGMSWKKTGKVNPKADLEAVAQKKTKLLRCWKDTGGKLSKGL